LLSRAEADLAHIVDADRAGATRRLAASAARVIMASGESGDRRRAWLRRLLADLLGTDCWIDAVPVIAQLNRAAFDALSAWLCHRLSTEADDGT
jgi:hypothetical protein